jgi:hypothetical protein
MTVLYKDVRDQIKTGDLLIWKKDKVKFFSNLFLSLVRIFTRSEFAHVAIAWRVRDRLFVIEATMPQVRIYPVSSFDEFYHIPMELDPTEEQLDYLLEKVGLDYSLKHAVWGYLGSKLDDTDEWQCAELATRFYNRLGLNLSETWTPTKLVNSILVSGEKTLRLIKNI